MAMLAMGKQMQTMNIEERKTLAEPTKVLENVLLDKSNLDKFTKIGTRMEESTDVFAWSHEDMPRIDPSVITH